MSYACQPALPSSDVGHYYPYFACSLPVIWQEVVVQRCSSPVIWWEVAASNSWGVALQNVSDGDRMGSITARGIVWFPLPLCVAHTVRVLCDHS